MPATSPSPKLSPWGEGGGLVQIGICVPITVLIILGAIFIAPEILIAAAVLAVGYALVTALLNL